MRVCMCAWIVSAMQFSIPHTKVCTIFILCFRMLLMTCAIFTTFSFSTCSSVWSMVMKVPVRPIPALQGYTAANLYHPAGICYTHLVDHHGPLGGTVLLLHSPVEGQDTRSIVRHPVVRPGREAEPGHLQWTL